MTNHAQLTDAALAAARDALSDAADDGQLSHDDADNAADDLAALPALLADEAEQAAAAVRNGADARQVTSEFASAVGAAAFRLVAAATGDDDVAQLAANAATGAAEPEWW